jgi:uncharacterized membrane protein YhaH (DUF805 family)
MRPTQSGIKGENMGIYLSVWKKYSQFRGRAGRKEYWVFSLIDFVVMYGIVGLSLLAEGPIEYDNATADVGPLDIAYLFYFFGGFLPRLALTVRRLHDTNKPGLWVLVGVFPLIGGLVMLYLTLQRSDQGDNYYGSMPGSYEENYG